MIQIKEIYTASNLLSLLRVFLAIPFYFMFQKSFLEQVEYARIAVIGLCLFAALTDVLDGYLARKLHQITEFGKVIDPLADKVCVIVIFVQMYLIGYVTPLVFWVVLLRDLFIFTAGIFISRKIKFVLPSNYLGKGTVMLIGVYIMLKVGYLGGEGVMFTVMEFLIIALSLSTLYVYGNRAISALRKENN